MRTTALMAIVFLASIAGSMPTFGTAKPCTSEAQAYIDSPDAEAPASHVALFTCLASAAAQDADTSADSSVKVLTLAQPSVPPPKTPPGGTWLPLPPDILKLLAANGYADFVSTGGLMVEIPPALLKSSISEMLRGGSIPVEDTRLLETPLLTPDLGTFDVPANGGFSGGGFGQ